MGLRDEIRASATVEQRIIGGVPWRLRPWDSPLWRFDTGGPTHPSRTVMGADAAMALPAFYAGVGLLSNNAASMPLRVYLQNMGRDGYPGKRLWTGPSIFDQPSVKGTLYQWIQTLMVSVLIQGNAWGFVTGRDAYGIPTGIEWIPPHLMYVHEAEDENSWNPLRAKVFVNGRSVTWHGPDAEVFHVGGLPQAGRIECLSPLRQFALTITAGIEAQRFGTDWYASGGFPPGTFQNAEIEVDAEQANEMRAQLVKSLRRREPLVYGRDWDYKPVTVPPSEAQFLDAMQMNACTTPDARLSMADGTQKRAGDLRLGDEVLAWNGTSLVRDRVTALAEMPSAPLVRVQVAGGRELTTTLNHPYLAARRPRVNSAYGKKTLDDLGAWVKAEDLRLGDYVRLGLDWENQEDSRSAVDPETAWVLGVLTGNGGLTGRTATFSTPDAGVARRLGEWARANGGKLVPVHAAAAPNCLLFNLTGVRDLLRKHQVLGKYAHEKRVPETILRAGRKAQAAFLSGYTDTDGTITIPGSAVAALSWTSVSRELLEDTRHLLSLLGISSALALSGAPGEVLIKGRKAVRRQAWRLQVQGVARIKAFAALADCAYEGKQALLGSWAERVPVLGVKSDYRWARITRIEDAGDGMTIGVTIRDTHTHVTEGLVTHNTQMAAILNVPPDRVGGARGDSLTYNTVEQSTLQVIEALRPWLVNMEQSFSQLLLPRNRMTKFFTDALLKTDLEARMNMYQIMRNFGLRTINEIRDLEDLGPLRSDIGDEEMPLTTMNAMGTRAGVIPKSFMKSVILEMDVATDRLIKLEKYIIPSLVKQGYPVQGTAPAPGAGGGGSSGGNFGTAPPGGAGTAGGGAGAAGPQPVTVNGITGFPIGKPNAPLPLAQDPASFLASLISVQRSADMPYEARVAAQEILVSICERDEQIRRREPWVNDPEPVRDSAPEVHGLSAAREVFNGLSDKGRDHL